jgi:hypothetical protein
MQAFAFPALARDLGPGNFGQSVVDEGEASCFYHPQKRSVIPCGSCGRFLCALCDVELDGKHVCPACLESGQKKGKLLTLQHRRILYDNIALGIALLPFLIWPFTIVTGPAAVVCGIAWWKKPGSILPRTRVRLLLAIFFGLGQMAVWGFAVWSMLRT